MAHVSITRTTNGTREKKKRNDAEDTPSLCFSLSSFSSFSLLSLRCNPSSLSTIKGETGRSMQGIARQADYDSFQAHKRTNTLNP
jgi:predicted transcriptional regulator